MCIRDRAEIASTTNENILTEKLLEEVEDDATRFTILNNFLDGFRGTVFRQTQFAEFEHAIHQADQNGEVLTSDFLNKLYADLNQEYYGLSKEDNPEIQYEWARIPHFYYNYYVCLLYTSPSPRDKRQSRMPSSAWKKKNFELRLI